MLKLRIAVMVLVWALLPVAHAQTGGDTTELLRSARLWEARGRHDLALQSLEKYRLEHAQDPLASLRIGLLDVRNDQLKHVAAVPPHRVQSAVRRHQQHEAALAEASEGETRRMNADVTYQAARITHVKKLPLDRMSVHVRLKDGVKFLIYAALSFSTFAFLARGESGRILRSVSPPAGETMPRSSE